MIAFIDTYRDRYGVEFLCRTMRAAVRGFMTSRGYRAAKTRTPSARQLRDELIVPEIQRLHKKNFSVYGVRKMHAKLLREGWEIGRDQTARLMRLGLLSVCLTLVRQFCGAGWEDVNHGEILGRVQKGRGCFGAAGSNTTRSGAGSWDLEICALKMGSRR